MAELVDATDLTNIVDILILLKFVPDYLNRISQRIEELSTSLKQNSKCFLNRNGNIVPEQSSGYLNYIQVPEAHSGGRPSGSC